MAWLAEMGVGFVQDLRYAARSLALVVRKSMLPVATGAAIGVMACFGAAFLASAIPARRAMGVDPMATLRYE